jgi:hypothetical protein
MLLRMLPFGLSRRHPDPQLSTHRAQLRDSDNLLPSDAGGRVASAAENAIRHPGLGNAAVLRAGDVCDRDTGRAWRSARRAGRVAS